MLLVTAQMVAYTYYGLGMVMRLLRVGERWMSHNNQRADSPTLARLMYQAIVFGLLFFLLYVEYKWACFMSYQKSHDSTGPLL